MIKITFLRQQIETYTDGTKTLREVMHESQITMDAPCGGRGKCGKCKVLLDTGEEVLACQYVPVRDIVVDTGQETKGNQILTEGVVKSGKLDPVIRQTKLLMPPCPSGQSISDWTRFVGALNEGSDQKTVYRVEPAIASALGELQKKSGGQLYALTYEDRVLQVDTEPIPVYLAAFDVGTTTVAAYLLDGESGKQIAVCSRMNPQSVYGADVINRANYVLEHQTSEVTDCIQSEVNEMLGELSAKAGIQRRDIKAVSLVGNTCMHHLFLGISPDSLVHAPYNPAVQESMILKASDYGLKIYPEAPLYMVPNVAGFVGADTVACLVATQLEKEDTWTLLIDIGTNGEMVLGKSGSLAACSTAAGPAFEGAGISCGMRGSEGAISKASWNGDGWDLNVIGDGKAVGICGSGLLDLVAEMLANGLMDETGQFEEDEKNSVKGYPAGGKVVLEEGDEASHQKEVALYQKDVRQLQLAKAAIASGVHLLAKKQGIAVGDIAKVWLAGAFGSFLSPKSACRIGLIPPELDGRITAVGNAAGEGAKQVLLDRAAWERGNYLAETADFIELAAMPEFQDRFVDELMFPDEEL